MPSLPPLLDVSDDVRAELGAEEAERLLAGDIAPGRYDCTSCRAPGDTGHERTSTVLFLGEETALLAFAHAACIPSQVINVSEEQLQGAVRSLTRESASNPAGNPAGNPTGNRAGSLAGTAAPETTRAPAPDDGPVSVPAYVPGPSAPAAPGSPVPAHAPDPAAGLSPGPGQAVLGVTCGQVLIEDQLHAALVIEPTSPIARPGSDASGDEFLPMLIEQGFAPVTDIAKAPWPVTGWSVLLAMGRLHAILQSGIDGPPDTAWWQAHQPLSVTDAWRAAATKTNTVFVYAGPVGSIGQQPREDLLRDALEGAAAKGVLVAAAMPLAGT